MALASVPNGVIDGAQPFGCRYVNFSNGVTCLADELKMPTSSQRAEDRTAQGTPQRVRHTRDTIKLTLVLQAPITSAGRPNFGSMATISGFDDNYGPVLFYVSKPVEYDESNSPTEIRKLSVEAEECLSGSVTTF